MESVRETRTSLHTGKEGGYQNRVEGVVGESTKLGRWMALLVRAHALEECVTWEEMRAYKQGSRARLCIRTTMTAIPRRDDRVDCWLHLSCHYFLWRRYCGVA